jgi:hypothetical protein
MKTTLSISLLFILNVLSATVFAQKTLTDVTIKYKINIESTKGEKAVPSALNGALVTLYLTKDKSRLQQESTVGSETSMYDAKAGKGFILKEYSAQKLMITVTSDNWAQKNNTNRSLKFTEQPGITNINGISCKKATATNTDGKNYTVFYDPSNILANTTYNNAFPQIEGMPVQYELQSGNLIFKYTLESFTTEPLAANKFDAPKAGFRTMTYEENQQLKKGE